MTSILKHFVFAAAVVAAVPAAVSAHTIVLENATISNVSMEQLNASKPADTVLIMQRSTPVLVPMPKPHPIPLPGPWCLSCPPFDLQERLLLPAVQK